MAAAALLPRPAAAHLYLVSSEPADGARLRVVPEELRLTFSEPVQLPFTHVELVGPDGSPVPLADLTASAGDPRVLLVQAGEPLRAGPYALVWRSASADGHIVSGRIGFEIEEDAEGIAALDEPGEATVPVHHDPALFPEGDGFGAGSLGYVLVRWLTFIGLLGVIGTVAFRVVVLGSVAKRQIPEGIALLGAAARRSADLGLAFSLVLVIAVLARLYAQSLAAYGASEAMSWPAVSGLLAGTVWGWGWLLQMAATVLVVVGFAAGRRFGRFGWGVATVGVVALAFTPALGGHAVAVPSYAAVAVLSDGLHVLGAGGWLGSLLAVIVIGIPVALRLGKERRGRAVAVLVNAFSPTALACAALVAATGVLSAAFHLGSIPDLWQSAYGRTLLFKVGALSVVFGTGAYNWLRVRPRLGDDAAARTLRRSAGFELTVGVAVLLVTAVLVATPPPLNGEPVRNEMAAEVLP